MIGFNYERNGCNRRAERNCCIMFFAHTFIDSTTLRTKVNCVYVWNCDANTLYSTLGAFHVLFYRRCDVLHYQIYAASTTVSIMGLPSNATAVTVTTSLLPLSFFICCRVPVSRSYSPHVSIHRRGMDVMMLLDRLMSYRLRCSVDKCYYSTI